MYETAVALKERAESGAGVNQWPSINIIESSVVQFSSLPQLAYTVQANVFMMASTTRAAHTATRRLLKSTLFLSISVSMVYNLSNIC